MLKYTLHSINWILMHLNMLEGQVQDRDKVLKAIKNIDQIRHILNNPLKGDSFEGDD